jgi:UrcA family protein
MLRTITISALLVLGIATAQAEEEATTLVSYSDLNLSKPSDARILAARLEDAATSVCVKANPNLGSSALQNCVDVSVHMAMSRIRSTLDEAVQFQLANVRTAMRD